MAVPTLITDLSTTASSNAPAGSDSPSTLDDIQRAHASFIAQLHAEKLAAAGVTAFAATVLDDANAAAARTTLGAAASGANGDITSLTALASINGGQLGGLRNKIINGGFAINQRAYVSTAAVGAGLYGHDRWKMAASGDTYSYSTTANKTTVTVPSGKVLQQVVEGLNLQTGTYTLSWEGTAQGKIGAGSLAASGVTGSITGGTDTTIEFGPGTVANIQLEFGSVATPFEHRPIGMELALCQRYYATTQTVVGVGVNSTIMTSLVTFPQTMRAAPTLGITGAFVVTTGTADFTQSSGAFSLNSATTTSAQVAMGNFTGMTAFHPYIARLSNTNAITLSAEL